MENDCLIHIGYPKCGTTFLQQEVFRKITNKTFVNKGSHVIDRYICNNNLADKKIINTLISDESIIGEFKVSDDEILNRLENIKKNFFKPSLIIFFRDYDELIKSLYSEWVAWGELSCSYQQFRRNIDSKRYKLNYKLFDCSHLLSLADKVNLRVRLYNYDDFRLDNKSFIRSFMASNDIEYNSSIEYKVTRKSLGLLALTCLRVANILNKSYFKWGLFKYPKILLVLNFRLAGAIQRMHDFFKIK